jgi:hypothetical protein
VRDVYLDGSQTPRYSAVWADRNSLSMTTMFPMAVSSETATDPTPRTASENRSACTVY